MRHVISTAFAVIAAGFAGCSSSTEERPSDLSAENAREIDLKQDVTRQIAHRLELAYSAFEQRKFDRCIRRCNELLLIDPHYSVARELREDSEKTRHKGEYFSVLAKKVEQWRKLTVDGDQSVIPWPQSVRFPSREEWVEISKQITASANAEGKDD